MNNVNEKKGKPSNGRHILREAYAVKRNAQMYAVEARQVLQAHRLPEDQILMLDQRLGAGVGASKERLRLVLQIAIAEKDVSGIVAAEKALAAAKMESRGYRIMRRLRLTARSAI